MSHYLIINYTKSVALARMHALPHPTREYLQNCNLCAVCGNRIQVIESAKKDLCGHVLHVRCLRFRLRREETCPTCGSNVMEEDNYR